MKVLVTGAQGQLGYDVCKRLDALGIENRGIDVADVDLTDHGAVERCFGEYGPDCVVHCAAYTQVDKAESDRDLCFAVNEAATRHIAELCRDRGAKLVYISTDYVFEGAGDVPYEADSPVNPQGVYGESKLAGERAVLETVERFFIVRTSWVFGAHGHNFVRTMGRLGRERDSLNVVCDQVGSPTYTGDLADLLCAMLPTEKYGVYHATNEGFCSWAEFAGEIMEDCGLRCRVNPIPSEEYPTPAKRPLNSRLSKDSLDRNGFERLPHWRDGLRRYLEETDAGS
jgi:dTDP-4-dehydrorhamnose reductase